MASTLVSWDKKYWLNYLIGHVERKASAAVLTGFVIKVIVHNL
jgi:hypothetical protein